ncbi:branched-chain amino acid ABC transporter permease [Cytobacillus depressus]|uniref:Branched-chain amino acid ABC transporter permease n=1 Tax=Cytobacillus depressus TaxID=1602942 RepID=A0A6L3V1Z1_9BACI|nr:branched-chain amino acid ABC transporter permease [Cytobacillus depressus]KAB2330452.1 branched-chain amino acid ABC transporter permease [Cytobacillus depressus]
MSSLYPNRIKPLLIFVILVSVLPFIFNSSYMLSLFILIGIYSMITIGLSLLMGYAGQISLGHAAYFAIGAYTSGVLTVNYGVSPWLALIAGMLVTALISFLIGIPILKLKEHFLAFATIGVNVIVYIVLLGLTSITKGAAGLSGIPKLNFFGIPLKGELSYYFFVWGIVLMIVLVSLNIVYSHVGRVLRGIHDSEIATLTQGINVAKFKLHIFVISAIFASAAGSIYAHFMNFITPSTFHVLVSVQFLVMVVVGGSQSIWGAITGAFLMTMLGEWVKNTLPLFFDVGGEVEIMVYGVVLVLVMMLMPKGLLPTFSNFLKLKNKTKTLPVKEEGISYENEHHAGEKLN